MKIEPDKWYLTDAGERVRVACIDCPGFRILDLYCEGRAQ